MNPCRRKKGAVSPKAANPTWLIAVRCSAPAGNPIRFAGFSAMWTSATSAKAVIPTNIEIESAPMIIRVDAALRLFGGWNAGIPFDTASTPVRAVHPEAKARRTRNTTRMPLVSPT